jgi:hypothetical protein
MVKPHVQPSGDPLWELATRLIEKRTKPGDSIKSILRELGDLYAGLKRLAPKNVSETPMDQVRKFLSGKSEVSTKARTAKRRVARSAKRYRSLV